MGNTKVLAAVFGPHEVTNRGSMKQDRAVVRCEYSMAPFSTGERRTRGKSDRRSMELSMVIRQTMEAAIITELMPRSQIDIFVHVLQADGGTRCACINAASMALSSAGIPLHDMVAACAAGYLESTPLLDLNYVEDSAGGPDLTMAIHPNLDKVLLLQMDAKLPIDILPSVTDMATEGCKAVGLFMRQQLLEFTRSCVAARGALKA
eukprot:jgi/Mesvir1/22337/Mv19738-RA.1